MSVRKKSNPIRMPRYSDHTIYWCTLVLAVFGLVMITSASMGLAAGNSMYLVQVIVRQLLFLIGGYISMLFMAKQFNFERVKANLPLLVLGTGAILLLALMFRGVGGARAWIRIPVGSMEITIQPSEFAKISIMLIIAAYLGDLKSQKYNPKELVKAPLLVVGTYLLIVAVLQSDFGSAVVMMFIALVCFLIPRNRALMQYQMWIVMMFAIGIVGVVVILTPLGTEIIKHLPLQQYQINRFLSSIDPFIDQYNSGYQLINGLVSFASGGLMGVGFGNSIRKYTNFPAANTDFILAIVVEELGFMGFLVIFVCYFLIMLRLFKYAFKVKSEKARIVLVGTAMYIFIHFVFNVGGVTGLIPLTGVPLLMISAGGSSTMAIMLALGVCQAIIHQIRIGVIE